jgi:UvrD-like helicase C-terminal domain
MLTVFVGTDCATREAGCREEFRFIVCAAKGQEWKMVRILNVVDGCIPSDMATGIPEEIEEERRLLYFGMTRAKDELDLIVPHRFFTYNQAKWGDRHVYASVSRFIPKSIHDAFERRHSNGQVAQILENQSCTRKSILRLTSGECGGRLKDTDIHPHKSIFRY